ncbi:MAG: DUF1987 domain-containing protein [Bacteroidetes bacterium]|nr:DUF1987 domain-containing protein [Bacteroidota bacterium]
MEDLKLDLTEDTPAIIFNADSGVLELSGRSLPEDAAEFYQTALDWLDSYSEKPNAKTNIIFKLEYFNTSSSKLILDLLTKLEDLHNNGTQAMVVWYSHSDDEDMQEAGEEFAELIEIPFTYKTY